MRRRILKQVADRDFASEEKTPLKIFLLFFFQFMDYVHFFLRQKALKDEEHGSLFA